MQMPASIKKFEKYYFASLGLTCLQTILVTFYYQLDAATALLFAGIVIVVVLIFAGIALLTSRKKSVICKWLLIGLWGTGGAAAVKTIPEILEGDIPAITNIIILLIQFQGIYALMTEESKAWYASKNQLTVKQDEINTGN